MGRSEELATKTIGPYAFWAPDQSYYSYVSGIFNASVTRLKNNIDVLNLGLSTGTLTPSTEIQLGMSCTIFIKEGDVFWTA